MEELGIVWFVNEAKWEEGYAHFQYYKDNNDGHVPVTYKTEDGYKLGQWVDNQRQAYKREKLTDERIRRLEALGIVWEPSKK